MPSSTCTNNSPTGPTAPLASYSYLQLPQTIFLFRLPRISISYIGLYSRSLHKISWFWLSALSRNPSLPPLMTAARPRMRTLSLQAFGSMSQRQSSFFKGMILGLYRGLIKGLLGPRPDIRSFSCKSFSELGGAMLGSFFGPILGTPDFWKLRCMAKPPALSAAPNEFAQKGPL